jgi:hypothetical protein
MSVTFQTLGIPMAFVTMRVICAHIRLRRQLELEERQQETEIMSR